jgi:hypothetical protein
VRRPPPPGVRRTDAGRELWQAHHDRVFDGVPCFTHLTDDDRRVLCDLLRRMADDPPADRG